MDLPTFNGQGTGPQGAAGIPPESFGAQGLQESALKKIGAEIQPEDSAPVQKVLDEEAAALSDQLVGDDQSQQQAPAQPDTPAQDQSDAETPHQQAAQGTQPDRGVKVRQVIDKYGGDLDKIAEAYAHTDAARTRAQQKANDLGNVVSDLAQKVDSLSAQLAVVMTPQAGSHDQPIEDAMSQAAPNTPDDDTGDFWSDPEAKINRIVQQNMLALKEAERRVEEKREFDRLQSDPETQRLRPVMAALYAEDRDVYDALPQNRALNLLRKRAAEREAVAKAAEFYSEIKDIDGTGTPGQPAPESGSLPQGANSHHADRQPTAGGNWSNTKAFKRLWRTGDGSTDEMKAIMETLRERQFGDHIKIR